MFFEQACGSGYFINVRDPKEEFDIRTSKLFSSFVGIFLVIFFGRRSIYISGIFITLINSIILLFVRDSKYYIIFLCSFASIPSMTQLPITLS